MPPEQVSAMRARPRSEQKPDSFNNQRTVRDDWLKYSIPRQAEQRRLGQELSPRSVAPSVEWLRAREREVGVRLLGGTASNLLSYRIALAAYAAAGFALPPAAQASEESAEARFRRLLREQAFASDRQSRQPGKG